MLNQNQKRRFVCTLMAALLLFVAAASVANARNVDVTSPPTPVESSQAAADTPNLIITVDGNVTALDNQSDQPNLYQGRGNPPFVDNSSAPFIAQNEIAEGAEQDNLIATQTSPDFSVLIASCFSLLVAAAVVGALVFVRRRKAD